MRKTVPDLPNQLLTRFDKSQLLNKYLPTLQSAFPASSPAFFTYESSQSLSSPAHSLPQTAPSPKHSLPEPFNDLFPNLHLYRFKYNSDFHSVCNLFYNIYGFKPSIGVYCADSYFGGSCLPDVTFNADKILSKFLCPYGLPECRFINPETSLPFNFDPASEVYILNVSFTYKLKLHQFPSFSHGTIYYPPNLNYYEYNYSNKILFPSTEWYTSDSNLATYVLTQPQWEGIKKRYNLSNIVYHYALVFKAKPLLFNQVIQYYLTQTDTSLFNNFMYSIRSINAVYPAIKSFFTAYHREEVLNYVYSKQLSFNDIFVKDTQLLEPGTLVYTSYNCFGIVVKRDSIYLDPHLLPHAQLTYIMYPDMKYFKQTNNFISGNIIFPTNTLTPELSRIRNHIIRQYNDFTYTVLKNRKRHY